MPTLLDYAGLNGDAYSRKASTTAQYFDGISFNETLRGNNAEQVKHEFLYWEFHETNMMALRMGNWKLIVKNGNKYLYDLSVDIHEDNDIAAQNPQIVEQMVKIINEEHTKSDLFTVTMPGETSRR
jgi:arylsulfatase A-like enzyme